MLAMACSANHNCKFDRIRQFENFSTRRQGVVIAVEAISKCSFHSCIPEYLSFRQGSIMQVAYKPTDSPRHYNVKVFNRCGLVAEDKIEILPNDNWYYGSCDRTDSEIILSRYPHKRFLIRRVLETFYLSFRLRVHENNIRHFRIFQLENGHFTFFSDSNGRKEFTSMAQLAKFVEVKGWYSCCWWAPWDVEVCEPKMGLRP